MPRSKTTKYRLVALDLDGTLLGDHYEISQENISALREVKEKGIHVVVVTGRGFAAARPFAMELGLGEMPLVSHNGALVKMAASCELIECQFLPSEVALVAVALGHELGIRMSLSDEPQGLGQAVLEQVPSGRLLEYLKKSKSPYHVTSSLKEHLEEMVQGGKHPIHLTFSGPCKQVDAIEDRLSEELPGKFRFLKTAYRKRDFTVGDVLCARCSKGQGLKRVAQHLSLEAQHVLAMGDNENDLDMLRYAGKGVLMGNAEPHLREPGFEVTGTNIDHGVAQALKRWILSP